MDNSTEVAEQKNLTQISAIIIVYLLYKIFLQM